MHKKKYEDTDTRSLIVTKKSDEFRGVGWVVLTLFVLVIFVLIKG